MEDDVDALHDSRTKRWVTEVSDVDLAGGRCIEGRTWVNVYDTDTVSVVVKLTSEVTSLWTSERWKGKLVASIRSQ